MKIWEWTFFEPESRWDLKDRVEIFTRLSVAISHINYNPDTKDRVNNEVQCLLDMEVAGNLSVENLIEKIHWTVLFRKEELENTEKQWRLVKIARNNGIN